MASSAMAMSAQTIGAGAGNGKEEFTPHWYMQVQAGAAHTIGETAFDKLLSPAGALSAGYKFTPLWGLRAGVSGWQAKGAWVNPLQDYKFYYLQGNVDVTLDLGNLCGGYKPGRIVNPYLFAGAGFNGAFNNDEAVDIQRQGYHLEYLWTDNQFSAAGRFGLGADFRVSRRVAINLEANANILSDKFNSKKAHNVDWQCNLVAGLTIRLGGKKKVPEPVAEEPVQPVAPAQAEKPAEEKRVVVPPARKEEKKVEPLQENVFFKINSAVISSSEEAKVNRLVAYLKAHPKARVSVCGYADKATGTAQYNKVLSQKRAKAVAAALAAKGIDASRVDVDFKGDTVQPFDGVEKNRVTICMAE